MSSSSAINSSLPNRWILAIAAFCMQLALGSVYAWSVFLKPVASLYYHVPSAQLAAAQLKPTNITFSVVLVALGITAGFGGYLNNRFGPRVIATAGGILYGLGVILAAFAAPNLIVLYLTYGIIGGIGIGLGYIVALAWKELPFLALLAFSVLATRGPALEETARSLGAGPWAVFRRVTWPLLWRGLLPGIVSVFAFVAGSYEAAVLLAPSDPLPLPLLTYERYTDPDLGRRADAYVLVLLGLGLAAVAVALHEWARARAESFDS